MPFTKQERRQPMLDGKLKNPEPGDFCFKHYHRMMDEWGKARRWTTAHSLFVEIVDKIVRVPRLASTMDIAAHFLAFLVFFIKHVMKYEDEKEQENGTI